MGAAHSSFTIGNVRIAGRVLTAPMTGVSDLPFRRAASKLGAAYVATEMVACEMLARERPDVVRRAAVGEGLAPMVIQLVGREAHWIAKGAAMAEAAGAEIIDLNMGCPAKEVTGALSGSALMRDLELAERLIGAAVGATSRPVTLKMRLGWDDASKNAPELAAVAERAGIKAITVHGRTRQQFYRGAADWRAVADVKRATALPVIVNGDIVDADTARGARAIGRRRGHDRPRRIWTAMDRILHRSGAQDRRGDRRTGFDRTVRHRARSFARQPWLLWRRAGDSRLSQTSGLVCGKCPLAGRRGVAPRGQVLAVPSGYAP